MSNIILDGSLAPLLQKVVAGEAPGTCVRIKTCTLGGG